MQIQGIYCAVWVPVNSESEVLWEVLETHLQFLTSNAVDGLMVLGTTGHFPFFSVDHRQGIRHEQVRQSLSVFDK